MSWGSIKKSFFKVIVKKFLPCNLIFCWEKIFLEVHYFSCTCELCLCSTIPNRIKLINSSNNEEKFSSVRRYTRQIFPNIADDTTFNVCNCRRWKRSLCILKNPSEIRLFFFILFLFWLNSDISSLIHLSHLRFIIIGTGLFVLNRIRMAGRQCIWENRWQRNNLKHCCNHGIQIFSSLFDSFFYNTILYASTTEDRNDSSEIKKIYKCKKIPSWETKMRGKYCVEGREDYFIIWFNINFPTRF